MIAAPARVLPCATARVTSTAVPAATRAAVLVCEFRGQSMTHLRVSKRVSAFVCQQLCASHGRRHHTRVECTTC